MNKWSRLLTCTLDIEDNNPSIDQNDPISFYLTRFQQPKTISYRKQRDTDFYDVVDYNRQVTQDLFKSIKA